MKTAAPPRLRYRPPERWPLYGNYTIYEPPTRKHNYVRVKVNNKDAWVCVNCGTTEIVAV